MLRAQGLAPRRPDLALATMDHSTPTRSELLHADPARPLDAAARQVAELERNCRHFGIELLDLGHELRGIVHIVGPELGLTQPGKTVVCGDSHTSTHGAF